MHNNMDFSLVICTYNPDVRILQRCLQAVQNLDTTGLSTEILLVDNNSTTPLSALPCVEAFAKACPQMELLLVKQQGVQYARMAAIERATGTHIVYFDYDNEPQPGYLQALKELTTAYPQVAAWGPGNVEVDFIDGVPEAISGLAYGAFQQRRDTEIRFASEPDWQPCYPFGTGLCTKAFLLKQYVAQASQGMYTLEGRNGNKLSSGEDTQMVLLCIKEGYAAGVAPALKLTHIIPGNRANARYLERLLYGTFVCYELSLLQVFPDQRPKLEAKLMAPARFARKAWVRWMKLRLKPKQQKKFDLIHFISVQAGTYAALDKPLPAIVQHIIDKLAVA